MIDARLEAENYWLRYGIRSSLVASIATAESVFNASKVTLVVADLFHVAAMHLAARMVINAPIFVLWVAATRYL
jgi:hypothetical protein